MNPYDLERLARDAAANGARRTMQGPAEEIVQLNGQPMPVASATFFMVVDLRNVVSAIATMLVKLHPELEESDGNSQESTD